MSMIHIYDATADDSDKTFTVRKGTTQKLLWGTVALTSTATVGNRQLDILVSDEAGNAVWTIKAGATQAASLTYTYVLRPNMLSETSVVGLQLIMGIPGDFILLPEWTVRVYDSAAVDAAADDMTVNLIVSSQPS